jgi:alpha-tubulin suppressor-like RCC1 family protein
MSSELLIMGSSPQSYTLDAWGQNPYGQLGENPHYFGFQQLTTGALSTETFVQVESCGFAHFALTNTGNLYGWGNSQAIGSGVFLNYVSYLTPQLVLSNVAQFSIGNGQFASPSADYIVMAIKTDGTLWMTGNTSYNWGRTSFTYATDWNIWTQVNTVGSICQKVSVSKDNFGSSSLFALLLKTDGTMWAIGNNTYGVLGQGNTTSNFATFQQVKGPGAVGFLTNVVDISAGGKNSYAVLSSGAAYGWGYNVNGEVGNGTTMAFPNFETSPSQVEYGAVLGGANVSTAEKIFAWGDGAYITITPGSGPVAYQLKTNLYGWGDASSTNYALTALWGFSPAALPIVNAKASSGAALPEPLTVTKVMGSLESTTAIITSGGLLLTWGGNLNNAWGQAGRSTANQYGLGFVYPTAVDTATNWSFIPEVAATTSDFTFNGAYAAHTLAGKSDGKIYGTGANIQQSFGIYNKNNSPTQIGTNRQWITLSSGYDNASIFINNQGELYGVGYNSLSVLGSLGSPSRFSPTQLSAITTPWVDVSTNGFSSAAILKGGILYAWGYNNQGECGSPSGVISSITQVTNYAGGLPTSGALSVFMGGTITSGWGAVLYDNGKVYAAGSNLYYTLGNGGGGLFNVSTFFPVQDSSFNDLQNVEKVWYCFAHAFAKLSVGDPTAGGNNIVAWGDNSTGALGVGNTSVYTRATPAAVYNPFVEITKIVGGDGFSIVLYADGTVESTGRNNNGQLGNGFTTNSIGFAPVRNSTDTADLTDVVDIGATRDSAFAVLSNGDIYVWGRNTLQFTSGADAADPYYGLLVPSNNTAFFTLPTLVGNYPNVASIPTTPTVFNSAFILRNI